MLTRVDDHVVVLGRKHFDFRQFSILGAMTTVAVKTFESFRSKNEVEYSRDTSNAAVAVRFRAFLKFAMKEHQAVFGIGLCLSYREYLKRTKRPLVQVSNYNTCIAIMRYAMQHGYCGHFNIPRGLTHARAMAASGARKTLADLLNSFDSSTQSQNDVNRHILLLLHEFCWKRVFIVRDRQRTGWRWKQEVEADQHVIEPAGPREGWSREELLRYIVQMYWFHASGTSSLRVRSDEIIHLRHATLALLEEPFARAHAITMLEVHDHLLPKMEQIAVFLPLFALKRLNPNSIGRMKTNMLIDTADARSTAKNLRVRKDRAGRELTFGPYAVGGPNARTIPRAFLILKEITDRIRDLADDENRDILILRALVKRTGSNRPVAEPCGAPHLLGELPRLLQEDGDPRFDMLRKINGAWSLKMIRATVIVTDRHRGSLPSTQRLANHKRPETTTIYLNTPDVASILDEKIEQGQLALYDSVRTDVRIVSPTVDEIVGETDCSGASAQDALDDKLNLGYGISLISDQAIVVDTPLNYLRMETWSKTIEAAQQRIEANNPARWEAVWRPQLVLYQQALKVFPRKTAVAAAALRSSFNIAFAEPD